MKGKRGKFRLILFMLVVCSVLITLILMPNCGGKETLTSENYTILIDAGHGGVDGGVVGESGAKESDINLAIAKILEDKLEHDGINVVMTRTHKDAIAGSKHEDMMRRMEIIKETRPDLVISVHTNKFVKEPSRRGVQVFYDDTNNWKKHATIMQRVMNEYINKVYAKRTDIAALGGDYFITKTGDIPSIIVECGFISNSEDERLLLSNEYRDRLADAMRIGALTILEYNL